MKSRPKTRVLRFFIVALPALISACSSSPNSPRSLSKREKIDGLMKIASAAVAEKDSISALETLNRIKELDDSIPQEHYLFALAYLNKNEMALAEASARTALGLDPKFTAAKNALGKILLDQGKLNEAEPLLKSAASDILYRESVLPKINLGILYFKKLDYVQSEKWLNQAISEGGAITCMAQIYLGKIMLERNELAKADRHLSSATKGACSGISEAHFALGQTLVRQKRFDEARSKFIEIQRLFPDGASYEKAAEYLREIP
ncbi:MAG: tetratricopeptide repeat protein [Bdellovibrionales bacterium]|nr:tetratricopeptide repeat protein [Bdellovibrionales bacterium]